MSLKRAALLLVLASTTSAVGIEATGRGPTSRLQAASSAAVGDPSPVFTLERPSERAFGERPLTPLRRPSEATPVTPKSGTGASADESALRYYASQNDSARVAAEIRRLKSLHPSWDPPHDLFDGDRDPAQEQALWSLLAEGRIDDVRAEVQEIQERLPNWRPSADLVAKFEQAEARHAVVEASKASVHSNVLAVVEERPSLLACGEMDVLWRVAEALVHTGAADRAFELYRFVLTRCPDAKERFATVQKASLLLSPAATERLIASGGRSGERNPYEAVRLDLQRRRIGDAIANPGADVNVDELRAFESRAEQQRSSGDAQLLGWYRYSRKDWTGAARWFRLATEIDNPPKAIEGYALTLRQQGNLAEAERVAYEARKADPMIEKLYIEIMATELTRSPLAKLDASRLARFAPVVEETKSVVGSQALGWYHYNIGSPKEAEIWFARSVAAEPTEANTLGLALSANKLKKVAEFRALIREYGPRFPAVAGLSKYSVVVERRQSQPSALRVAGQADRRHGNRPAAPRGEGGGSGSSRSADEAVALYKSGQYAAAVAALDRRAGRAREDEGLSLIRGWSLYHMGDYNKAHDHFSAMDSRRSTTETQHGKYYSKAQTLSCIDPRKVCY